MFESWAEKNHNDHLRDEFISMFGCHCEVCERYGDGVPVKCISCDAEIHSQDTNDAHIDSEGQAQCDDCHQAELDYWASQVQTIDDQRLAYDRDDPKHPDYFDYAIGDN